VQLSVVNVLRMINCDEVHEYINVRRCRIRSVQLNYKLTAMLGLGLGLGLDTDGLVNVTARLQDFLHNGLLLICFQFWTCAVMFFKTKTSAVKTKTAQKWS